MEIDDFFVINREKREKKRKKGAFYLVESEKCRTFALAFET